MQEKAQLDIRFMFTKSIVVILTSDPAPRDCFSDFASGTAPLGSFGRRYPEQGGFTTDEGLHRLHTVFWIKLRTVRSSAQGQLCLSALPLRNEQ